MVRVHKLSNLHRTGGTSIWVAGVGCLLVAGAFATTPPASASSPAHIQQSRACRSCVGQGITAITDKSAFLVGFRGGPGKYETWIRNWNGSHWHNDVSVSPGANNELFGVDGSSPTDVWTVGWYYGQHRSNSLLEHWDGSAWTWVPGPLTVSAPLYDVSTVASNNAWAVGNYQTDDGRRTLILHWDGSAWSQVASPNPDGATNITLTHVSADSATDAWAIGTYKLANPGRADAGYRSYLLHWNGSTWTEVPTVTQNLQDVSADSPTDAWAVGSLDGDTVTEHWDGSTWSRVTSPNPGPGPSRVLQAVDVRSSTDAWAAGFFDDITGQDSAMILHWDGHSWTDASAPAPQNSYLYSISADAGNDAWALGSALGNGKNHLLLEKWDGFSWTEG